MLDDDLTNNARTSRMEWQGWAVMDGTALVCDGEEWDGVDRQGADGRGLIRSGSKGQERTGADGTGRDWTGADGL
jgi:hypothetical protein